MATPTRFAASSDNAATVTPGADNGGAIDGEERTVHDVLLKLHPRATWKNSVLTVSVIVSLHLLFCSLFWYIETVGANFVHQWALMLAAFVGGAIGIIVLTFIIPIHLNKAYSNDVKQGRDAYPYSPWHRWTLWTHYVAIVVQTAIMTVSMWAFLERENIEIDDGIYDPTLAPASPTAIRYGLATLASILPSGILFFITLYAIVRHVYAEAGDVKSYAVRKTSTSSSKGTDDY